MSNASLRQSEAQETSIPYLEPDSCEEQTEPRIRMPLLIPTEHSGVVPRARAVMTQAQRSVWRLRFAPALFIGTVIGSAPYLVHQHLRGHSVDELRTLAHAADVESTQLSAADAPAQLYTGSALRPRDGAVQPTASRPNPEARQVSASRAGEPSLPSSASRPAEQGSQPSASRAGEPSLPSSASRPAEQGSQPSASPASEPALIPSAPQPLAAPSYLKNADASARPYATSKGHSKITLERALLGLARRQLKNGDGMGAQLALERLNKSVPHGAQAEQRQLLEIQVLLAIGAKDRARAAARDFAKAYPQSPKLAKLSGLLLGS